MNTVYNEEKIIKYVQNYYIKNNNSPKLTENIHPFTISLVRKIFGNWTNVLKRANLPLRSNPPQIVNCQNCNVDFKKSYAKIKKSINHFCSHSCAATINNPNRTTLNRIASNETKQKISESLKKFNKEKIKKIQLCIACKKEFKGKRKTCSSECLSILRVENGKIAGKISQLKRPRRSLGEILFYDLCVDYFGIKNVLSNERIFKDKNGNYWDSDIIILNKRLAICYNGIWHYQKVCESHNLKQTQSQ